jgi:hypothetical protein
MRASGVLHGSSAYTPLAAEARLMELAFAICVSDHWLVVGMFRIIFLTRSLIVVTKDSSVHCSVERV